MTSYFRWSSRGLRYASALACATSGLLGGVGCEAPRTDSGLRNIELRDSAGIQVAEYSREVVEGVPEWRIGDQLATIGGPGRSEATSLYNVQGAFIGRDGDIFVANTGTKEVRVFSAGGEPIRVIGHAGDGPGEFRSLGWIGQVSPVLFAAWDGQSRRLSLFRQSGEPLPPITLDSQRERPIRPVGILNNGGIIFQRSNAGSFALRNRPTGEFRDSVEYLLVDSRHNIRILRRTGLGEERYLFRTKENWGAKPIIFGRTTLATVTGNQLVFGNNESLEFRMVNAAAVLVRIVRIDHMRIEVTESDASHVRDEQRSHFSIATGVPKMLWSQIAKFEGMMTAEVPFRQTLPAFDDLRSDEIGNLWVRIVPPPGARVARWIVLSPVGQPVAFVQIPATARLLHVAEDKMLLITKNENDEETIRSYRIEK